MRIGVLLLTAAAACATLGHSKRPHPQNVERDDIPLCDLGLASDARSLFASPEYRMAPGTEITLHGRPRGLGACASRACSGECCDEACSFPEGCAYALPIEDGQRDKSVCLASPELSCGGTDCSSFCVPFSDDPQRRYRFVGTVRYGESGRPFVDVTRYCRLE